MAYDITKLPDESAYEKLYLDTYCNGVPIVTTDGIRVDFYPENFGHAFYESVDRKAADKSQFSTARAERMLWIKETLQDPTAELHVGWDKKHQKYDNSRRVAVVKDDYVVIIWIKDLTTAKFITAYVADNSIGKILGSPIWTGI